MQVAAYIGWIGFGLVTSAMLVWVSRRLDRDRAILGGGLVLLGGWYLGFGVSAGHGMDVLWPQVIGGAFFALCGVAGILSSLLFLAAGWALHALWDLASPLFSNVSYMPHWTAPACLGFDLLIGGYLVLRWRRARAHVQRA